MSKLLEEIVGKNCAIETNDIGPVGKVLEVDDEWIKIEVGKKEGKKKIRLYPISSIRNIVIND